MKRTRMTDGTRKRRITHGSAKARARWLQDWVAERIGNLTGHAWGHDDEHLIEPRPMGQKGVDVILRGVVRRLFPFSVECKNSEQWSVPAAIKQARDNTQEGTDWLLFLKRNGLKPVVVLDAELFFKIVGLAIDIEHISLKNGAMVIDTDDAEPCPWRVWEYDDKDTTD